MIVAKMILETISDTNVFLSEVSSTYITHFSFRMVLIFEEVNEFVENDLKIAML